VPVYSCPSQSLCQASLFIAGYHLNLILKNGFNDGRFASMPGCSARLCSYPFKAPSVFSIFLTVTRRNKWVSCLTVLHGSAARRAITNFQMPAMSPTMTEGGIASWKKKEGESFSQGDVLLEIVSWPTLNFVVPCACTPF
jgi:hypothetical protein